ncbi:MAG: cell division protein FtsQ/DivIB [Candidatus Methylomirabilota bacterium]
MIRDYKTPRWKSGGMRRRERFPRLARLLKVLGVLLVIGGAAAGMWEGYRAVVGLPYFRVVEVEVEGNLQVASQDIIKGLKLSPDASILEVDLPALTRRVLQNPWIKEASIRRRLPLSLTVRIVERMPEVVFIADRRYLLSGDGVILAKLNPDELPTLPTLRAAVPRRVAIGERILSSEMVQGLSVWRQFQLANALKGERAHEIAMAGDGSYVVNLGGRMPTIRLRAEDMEGQLRRLGAALAASGQGLERFGEVDLRFRDRVVFAPGKLVTAGP